VPVPRIPAVDKVSHEDGWLVLDRPSDSYVDVPSEVYLREFRDTDPADIDQLARLCSLGLICPLTDPPFFHDLEWGTTGPVPRLWSSWLGALAVQLDLPREPRELELEKGWRRSAGKAVHVTEVAVRVWFVQRCTEHLLAYAAGEPVQPVWRDAVVYAGREPVRQPWRDAEDEAMAWRNFTEITDAALRDFHVRVSVATDSQPESAIGGVHTTLYSAAMLQLVNDLAEEVPYLTCANETCGRPFVRQRGRSEYGGNRMRGVLYCSNTCARAQYQREKRRRDRAAQNGAGV
jgi:hypothetical protein